MIVRANGKDINAAAELYNLNTLGVKTQVYMAWIATFADADKLFIIAIKRKTNPPVTSKNRS